MTHSKRQTGEIFQQRLRQLIQRSGLNRSQFASSIGINRSALGLLLSEQRLRMPRAETLCRMAGTYNVSVDWLLGLSQSEQLAPEISSAIALEKVIDDQYTLLAQWHTESIGYKIRYVPSRLPDSLMTEQVIEHERQRYYVSPEERKRETSYRLEYNRQTESDMEVCMPMQQLQMLAKGEGIWQGLSRVARQEQLRYMVRLLDDLYPTYRLFLYDGLEVFTAPFTIFGIQRVAIYIGGMYVVINSAEGIRTMTRHFDHLIRKAQVNPHESATFVKNLIHS